MYARREFTFEDACAFDLENWRLSIRRRAPSRGDGELGDIRTRTFADHRVTDSLTLQITQTRHCVQTNEENYIPT